MEANETAVMVQKNPQKEDYYSNFVPSALFMTHTDAF
jgi:hypothetical protein